MDEKVKICFDKDYKIKAFDPVKFSRGEELEKECGQFVEKISSFSEKVNTLVDVLEAHATRIDTQKLRVIEYHFQLCFAMSNSPENPFKLECIIQIFVLICSGL
jgi:Intraflagellar transport complex B, subunit 20